MADKFPTQNKMIYETGALSNDAFTGVGHLCIPKDLSLLNMRGYDCTTRKGVPYVYTVRFDIYQQDHAGKQVAVNADSGNSASVETDTETAAAGDHSTILRINGCQNNWAMRNAAVKWHAAREKMYRDAGVKKRSRVLMHILSGMAMMPTMIVSNPIDGVGAAFTAGTWDLSDFAYSEDSSFKLVLVGNGDDEETDAFSGNELQIGHSYLLSRISQQADTNLETEEGPAQFSVLKKLLSPSSNVDLTVEDNVTADARDEQDNPPYEVLDLSDSGDVQHNITEPVELGRAIAGTGSAFGSVVVDIPFGICDIGVRHAGGTDQAIVDEVMFSATVLGIYEMQG